MFLGIEIGGTKLQLGVGHGDGSDFVAFERRDVDINNGGQGIRDQIREVGPAWVEIKITAGPPPRWYPASRRARSNPLSPPSAMSARTTSGRNSRARCSASAEVAATPTTRRALPFQRSAQPPGTTGCYPR